MKVMGPVVFLDGGHTASDIGVVPREKNRSG